MEGQKDRNVVRVTDMERSFNVSLADHYKAIILKLESRAGVLRVIKDGQSRDVRFWVDSLRCVQDRLGLCVGLQVLCRLKELEGSKRGHYLAEDIVPCSQMYYNGVIDYIYPVTSEYYITVPILQKRIKFSPKVFIGDASALQIGDKIRAQVLWIHFMKGENVIPATEAKLRSLDDSSIFGSPFKSSFQSENVSSGASTSNFGTSKLFDSNVSGSSSTDGSSSKTESAIDSLPQKDSAALETSSPPRASMTPRATSSPKDSASPKSFPSMEECENLQSSSTTENSDGSVTQELNKTPYAEAPIEDSVEHDSIGVSGDSLKEDEVPEPQTITRVRDWSEEQTSKSMSVLSDEPSSMLDSQNFYEDGEDDEADGDYEDHSVDKCPSDWSIVTESPVTKIPSKHSNKEDSNVPLKSSLKRHSSATNLSVSFSDQDDCFGSSGYNGTIKDSHHSQSSSTKPKEERYPNTQLTGKSHSDINIAPQVVPHPCHCMAYPPAGAYMPAWNMHPHHHAHHPMCHQMFPNLGYPDPHHCYRGACRGSHHSHHRAKSESEEVGPDTKVMLTLKELHSVIQETRNRI